MKIIILTIILSILNLTVHAQSQIILDCDFQDGNPVCKFTPNTFTEYDELLSHINFWKTCAIPAKTDKKLMTTPDYLHGDCVDEKNILQMGSKSSRAPMNNPKTNKFIGLASSGKGNEGIILPLDKPLKQDLFTYYELKFKASYSDTSYSSSGNGGTYDPRNKKHKFRVSFSKWSENWNSKSNQNELWEDITDHFIIPENSSSEWKTFSYKFKVPSNIKTKELGQLIIQAEYLPEYYEQFDDYLYIDDIVLTEYNACESICLGDNGRSDISIKNLAGPSLRVIDVNNDNILANFDGDYRSDFKLLFTNTMYYNVKIFDRWGGKQYEYESKDLNILEDDYMTIGGFLPDTTIFRWWGTSQDGTPLSYPDKNQVYTILINARNCNSNDHYATSIAFQHLEETHNYTDIRPQNFVDSLANCCPEILEVDDYTYTSSIRESRNNYIHAALNAPVSVENGVFVQYNAGKEIKVGSGFAVKPGGKFEAHIRPCEQNHHTQWKKTPSSNRTFIKDTKEKLSAINSSSTDNAYMIYPNPVKSELSVYSYSAFSTYIISDIYGRIIDKGTLSLGSNVINTTEYSKGTYTIKINDQYVEKIIKH